MKKILFYGFLFLFIGCKKSILNSHVSKERITKEINLSHFDAIEVNPLVKLKIYYSSENKMIVHMAKNIWEKFNYKITDNKLSLTNNFSSIVQNAEAVVHVDLYVANLKKIIANTEYEITSGNLLEFNNLTLFSENFKVGKNNLTDFDLQLKINQLNIIANGNSVFRMKGECNSLFVGFYGVNPVFQGKSLQVQHIKFYQRSSGDMHFFPLQSIKGDLYGYGNVYIYSTPSIIDIKKHYAGNVYFVN